MSGPTAREAIHRVDPMLLDQARVVAEALGLDPDMPVSELRLALACWERVKQTDAMTFDDLGRHILGDTYIRARPTDMYATDGACTLLRWLIGGDQ